MEGRRVDHDLGMMLLQSRFHRLRIGDINLGVRKRDGGVSREGACQVRSQLAARAYQHYFHAVAHNIRYGPEASSRARTPIADDLNMGRNPRCEQSTCS